MNAIIIKNITIIAAAIYFVGIVVVTALIVYCSPFRRFIEDWFSDDKDIKGGMVLFWPALLIFFAMSVAVVGVGRIICWIGGAYYKVVEHSSAVAQKRKEDADRRAADAKLQAIRKRGETEKYEVVSDMVDVHHFPTVHRIRALRDIPRHNVKFGDIGGWVESEKNLSREGDAWIGDDAYVFDDAVVSGDALVNCSAKVSESASVSGHALVTDSAVVCGNAVIKENAVVRGDAKVLGDTIISGQTIVESETVVEESV